MGIPDGRPHNGKVANRAQSHPLVIPATLPITLSSLRSPASVPHPSTRNGSCQFSKIVTVPGSGTLTFFSHHNSRFPTPHQCVSETHTVPPVPPHATAIATTPQAIPVTAIRDPLQLTFTSGQHPSEYFYLHTLTEMTRAITLPSKLLQLRDL